MNDDFGSMSDSAQAVHPPQHWLGLSVLFAVIALVASLFGSVWMAVLGYLLASFGAVGMIAKFRWDDRIARQSLYYSPKSQLRSFQRFLGAAILISCALCALPIAAELARR